MPDLIVKPARWIPGLRDGHPLARGLRAYWPFWEGQGDKVYDVASPYDIASHGALSGNLDAADWTVTTQGHALDFEGANDALIVIPEIVLPTSADCSIAFWGSRDANGNHTVLGNNSTSASRRLIWLDTGGGGTELYLETDTNGNDVSSADLPASYDGNMHHMVVSIKAGVASFYFDGVDVGQGTYTDVLSNSTTIHQIGAASTVFEYDGKIGHLAIWFRSLAAAEAKQLYAIPWLLITPRKKTYIKAPAVAVGNPWYYYQQERAVAS